MMLQLIDMFQYNGKNIDVCHGQVGGVTRDHDHLLRCGQTVAPRVHVITTLQCKC